MSEPEWMVILRAEVKRLGSIQAVAHRIGYSRTVVSLVLAGKYGKSTEPLALAVMTRLTQLVCPVLGEISGDACALNQNAPFRANNPRNIALYRACRSGCRHSFIQRES
ncbi:MAG: hypothetical protein QOJ54_1420 [Aliidongia sp.]|jgi:hypothetical protein|nr:hypothetical protein [Aliidongia sp.]